MVAAGALYFEIVDDVGLDLFLPLAPHVGAEDAHQHPRVDADGEDEHQSDEKYH